MKKGLMVFMTIIMAIMITGCAKNENSLNLTNKNSEAAIFGDGLNKTEIIEEVNNLLTKYDSKDVVFRLMINTNKTLENYNTASLTLNYEDNVPENAEGIANRLFSKFEKTINKYVENPMVSLNIRDSKTDTDIYTCDNKNLVERIVEEENEKKQNPLKIVSIDFSNYSNGYVDVNVKVLNQSGRDINYVKLNLFFYDKEDNVFRSEWTNDSAVIKDGAMQIVSKMTKNDFESVSVEVEKVSTR